MLVEEDILSSGPDDMRAKVLTWLIQPVGTSLPGPSSAPYTLACLGTTSERNVEKQSSIHHSDAFDCRGNNEMMVRTVVV